MAQALDLMANLCFDGQPCYHLIMTDIINNRIDILDQMSTVGTMDGTLEFCALTVVSAMNLQKTFAEILI